MSGMIYCRMHRTDNPRKRLWEAHGYEGFVYDLCKPKNGFGFSASLRGHRRRFYANRPYQAVERAVRFAQGRTP